MSEVNIFQNKYPPLLIEVPVPSQGSWRSCICELVVSIWLLSTILIFDFGIIPTVCGRSWVRAPVGSNQRLKLVVASPLGTQH